MQGSGGHFMTAELSAENELKMRTLTKAIVSVLFLFGMASSVSAQKVELPWHVSAQIGAAVNVGENVGSYFNHKKVFDLVNLSFGITGGYEFTQNFGVRLNLNLDRNSGACNSRESGGGFYPYTFSSFNVFADAMLNVTRKPGFFVPKFYLGAGLAHTYNFKKAHEWSHDWEEIHGELPHVSTSNTVFGFRVGFLGEFLITQEVGILLDVCGEFYTDKYDGLQPTKADQTSFSGYGGFPFDVRGLLSVGVAYHF